MIPLTITRDHTINTWLQRFLKEIINDTTLKLIRSSCVAVVHYGCK